MIKISNIINPKKVLKLSNGLEITLEGVDFKSEQFIESIKFRKPSNQTEAEELGAEYVSRLLKHCIKDVKGVVVEDEKGDEKPFEVQMDTSGKAIDDYSYTVIMRVLMQLGEEITTEVNNFYNQSRLQGVKIEDSKKKQKKD
jgi:hypothetical protein